MQTYPYSASIVKVPDKADSTYKQNMFGACSNHYVQQQAIWLVYHFETRGKKYWL